MPTPRVALASHHARTGTILSKTVPFLYGDKVALMKLGSEKYSNIYNAVQRDAAVTAVLVAGLLAWGGAKVAGGLLPLA